MKGKRDEDGEAAKARRDAGNSGATKRSQKSRKRKKKPEGKWANDSNKFRAMLKQARGGKLSKKETQALNTETVERVTCPTCGRKFNEEAGKRHFPFCAERQRKTNVRNGNRKNNPKNKRRRY